MAIDTQRSESISSDAFLNDSKSGSHNGDSSSSGDSDVGESQAYLGDEGTKVRVATRGHRKVYPLPTTPITTNRASQRTKERVYRGCRNCVERFSKAWELKL